MSPVSSRDGRLHAAMAGRGNPYAVLTPERLPLLRVLHAAPTTAAAATMLGTDPSRLGETLAPLIASGLVDQHAGRFTPGCVVADAGEVRRVDQHAQGVGRLLAERLLAQWDALADACGRLSVRGGGGIWALGFLLVGDRILDVGLLDALASEGRLMPPAPRRPAPDDPQARYYLWMVEGALTDLGQYGQRALDLPWPGWQVLTFGRYAARGSSAPKDAREAVEGVALAYAATHPERGPRALAADHGLPFFDRESTRAWERLAAQVAGELVGVYLSAEQQLRELWSSLRASGYRLDGFGEFICWFDHLAYAHAIDALVAAEAFQFPAAGFTAAVWSAAGERGAF